MKRQRMSVFHPKPTFGSPVWPCLSPSPPASLFLSVPSSLRIPRFSCWTLLDIKLSCTHTSLVQRCCFQTLGEIFSTWAPLTWGQKVLLRWGLSRALYMLSGILGLYPLDASNPLPPLGHSCDNQNNLQALLYIPWWGRTEKPPLRPASLGLIWAACT